VWCRLIHEPISRANRSLHDCHRSVLRVDVPSDAPVPGVIEGILCAVTSNLSEKDPEITSNRRIAKGLACHCGLQANTERCVTPTAAEQDRLGVVVAGVQAARRTSFILPVVEIRNSAIRSVGPTGRLVADPIRTVGSKQAAERAAKQLVPPGLRCRFHLCIQRQAI